jgi:hypothetical protein
MLLSLSDKLKHTQLCGNSFLWDLQMNFWIAYYSYMLLYRWLRVWWLHECFTLLYSLQTFVLFMAFLHFCLWTCRWCKCTNYKCKECTVTYLLQNFTIYHRSYLYSLLGDWKGPFHIVLTKYGKFVWCFYSSHNQQHRHGNPLHCVLCAHAVNWYCTVTNSTFLFCMNVLYLDSP